MSGAKCTTVSMPSEEAQRLREQARRADSAEAQRRVLEKQNRQRAQREKDLQAKIARNETRYEQHVRRLGKDMQNLERESRAALDRQKKDFQQKIKETVIQQQNYTDRRISQLDQKIQHDLAEQRQEYRTLVQQQKQHFDQALQEQGQLLQNNILQLKNSIDSRLQREEDIAQTWAETLAEEIRYIDESYRHRQFAPGEWNTLQERAQLIESNRQQHLFQAAIATAQEAYLQARQLRDRLELIEMQWDSAWQLAQESTTAALLLIDEHQLIDYLLENNETFQLEVNFWSQNAWQALKERVKSLSNQLNNDQASLSQTELEHIQAMADSAQEELRTLVENAKEALLSSIHRRDMQEMIAEKLAELGYRPIDSTYEQDDFRQAYHLKMENGNQEQIVTIVTPDKRNFANQLSINFYDRSPNEAVRGERLETIRQELQEQGLSVGPMQCEKGYEIGNAPEQRKDFNQLRQKATQQSQQTPQNKP
ncbi:hypothetical protein [Methylotuvimicrobium sp. KM2]|uniref:hypothetical protein n=1 Tax=Methylotuvimicrobium sp. KM2 TaxID=3133976 RepID=UPI00310170A0